MDTAVPGLHLINSAHIVNGTLNVNETVELANSAAARLLANTASKNRRAGALEVDAA